MGSIAAAQSSAAAPYTADAGALHWVIMGMKGVLAIVSMHSVHRRSPRGTAKILLSAVDRQQGEGRVA